MTVHFFRFRFIGLEFWKCCFVRGSKLEFSQKNIKEQTSNRQESYLSVRWAILDLPLPVGAVTPRKVNKLYISNDDLFRHGVGNFREILFPLEPLLLFKHFKQNTEFLWMRFDKMVARLHFYLSLTLHFIFKIFIRSNINNKPKTLLSYISVLNLVTFKQRSRNIIAKLASFFSQNTGDRKLNVRPVMRLGLALCPQVVLVCRYFLGEQLQSAFQWNWDMRNTGFISGKLFFYDLFFIDHSSTSGICWYEVGLGKNGTLFGERSLLLFC